MVLTPPPGDLTFLGGFEGVNVASLMTFFHLFWRQAGGMQEMVLVPTRVLYSQPA